MKKGILTIFLLGSMMLVFTGCGNKNNSATEGTQSPEATQSASPTDMPKETDAAPDDTDDNMAGNAVKDAADGAGNAVKDAVDGVGNAADDVIDGAGDAVDDVTGDDNNADNGQQ